MKKSVLSIVILIIFSMTYGISVFSQSTASNSSNPLVYPQNPSPTDSVYIYYSYVSTDGCPDFYFQRDSITYNAIYVSLRKIQNSGRICTQVITNFTAKMFLGLFKTNAKVFLDGKFLTEIIPQCKPDKEGVVVNCNGNLYIQEISPLAVMQLYVISKSSNLTLKLGDKVKFAGTKFSANTNVYAPCSVVGEANCITLVEPAPVCIKDRKGIVVLCNRQLFIQEITSTYDSAKVSNPKLFAFDNPAITDAAGVTKPALSLNNKVIFGDELFENTQNYVDAQCPVSGKVKCFELIYDAPECELNKEGIVVKCNNDLFIEEISIAAIAIKQLYAIKLNSNLLLKEGDHVKFGGYKVQIDSLSSTLPCRIVGVAVCAKIIETPPPPCIADRKGEVVFCENSLFIREITNLTDATEVYRLYAFENQETINADGTTSQRLSVGDIVKFAPVFFSNDSVRTENCPVVGKAVCITLIYDVPNCVPERKGKVITCNNQLYISEITPTTQNSLQLYAFKNNSNFETLKEGDYVIFGAVQVQPNTETSIKDCKIVGIAECWKIIESSPECLLNRKGVIEQGIDGCQGRLFIRENETRRLFAIALKNTENIAITGIKPGYKVIFGGYLTRNDSNNVSLCYTDGVAECLKVIDTNVGCEINRKGIIVKGTGACVNRVFVQDINSGGLYLFNYFDGMYRTDNYTTKLNIGDMVAFGAVEKDFTQYDSCKIAGVVLCYELISSAKTYSISGYALTESGKLNSGRAVLIHKPNRKVFAISKINEGNFEFKNIPNSVYTVYVIPAYPELMQYVPTFYVDKLFYRNADFFEVNTDKTDIYVKMRFHERKSGTGRISGNIHYETDNLNDSITVKNVFGESFASANFNIAVDIPVLLLDMNDQTVAWTITDIYGNYIFENVPNGSFKIFSETSTASANSKVELSGERNSVTANLVMKSNTESTSISDPISSKLVVYPIPAKDKLNVVLQENDIISILDVRGQLLYKKQGEIGINEINLSSFGKGLLILRTGNNTIKIVKE